MTKVLVMSAAVLVLMGGLAPVHAESGGITCEMSGSLEVKPGLRNPAPDYYGESYKVRVSGELTGCRGTGPSPQSGSLRAVVVGEGTCLARSGIGEGKVKWDNGNVTTFTFNTNDEASVATFTSTTTKSNEPAMQEGDRGFGVLRFTAETAKCNTPEGVGSATFEGQIASGSPN